VVAEYIPLPVPEEWAPDYIWSQLLAIADALATRLELDPVRVPDKPRVGMLQYFGDAGDPGPGKGFYGYAEDWAGSRWGRMALEDFNNVFTKAQYLDNADGQAAFVVTATDLSTETASIAALGSEAVVQVRALTSYSVAAQNYVVEHRSKVSTKSHTISQVTHDTQAVIETYLAAFDGGDVALGSGSLGTTSTDGFLFIPSVSGVPTGVPNSRSGFVPICYDSANNRLYVYDGGWVQAGLT